MSRGWIKKLKHYFLCILSLLFIYFLSDTSYLHSDFKEVSACWNMKNCFAYTHLKYLLFSFLKILNLFCFVIILSLKA